MAALNKLWVEQYRPTTLEQYAFQDAEIERKVREMISSKTISNNLLLSGIQGTGKTTLAKILVNAMELDESDVLIIKASEDTGVDVVRDKIKPFGILDERLQNCSA